ncbi:hypothetical protein JNM87_06710 [Candidatus Saccharibacteria bacterium]|nr:hypothetical protein [Candidatus Saccharibacteria bacterium]
MSKTANLELYFANWDPLDLIGFAGAPLDEYSAEAELVAIRYRSSVSELELEELIRSVFVEQFDRETILNVDFKSVVNDVRAILEGKNTDVKPPGLWYSVHYLLHSSKVDEYVDGIGIVKIGANNNVNNEITKYLQEAFPGHHKPVYYEAERCSRPNEEGCFTDVFSRTLQTKKDLKAIIKDFFTQ